MAIKKIDPKLKVIYIYIFIYQRRPFRVPQTAALTERQTYFFFSVVTEGGFTDWKLMVWHKYTIMQVESCTDRVLFSFPFPLFI